MPLLLRLVSGSFFAVCLLIQPLHAQDVIVNTVINGPVSPFLSQIVNSSNNNIRVTVRGVSSDGSTRLYARLMRISPAQFTITLGNPSNAVTVSYKLLSPTQLTNDQLAAMFGNFNPDKLNFKDIAMADFRNGLNYKLPEGSYQLCFSSDPSFPFNTNTGCASFTICHPAAPQLLQPVSNMGMNNPVAKVQPASPLIFSWIPPRYACGIALNAYEYNLEIREIFANQGVTDAINNPLVFRKNSIGSNIFLLDTNLYKDVLQVGKKYVVRVKANAVGTMGDTSIENNGYSRLEAFQYGNYSMTNNPLLPRLLQQLYISSSDPELNSKLDDVYTAVQKHERKDTSIELRHYIRLILMENNISYNIDAVELFLSMNQDLMDSKRVQLSYKAKIPEFPAIPENSQKLFDHEYAVNLSPDSGEVKKFIRHKEALAVSGKAFGDADSSTLVLNRLIGKLTGFYRQVYSVSRVTVKLVNDYLSELLYDLDSSRLSAGKAGFSTISGLANNIEWLISSPVVSASFHQPEILQKNRLSYYTKGGIASYNENLSGYTRKGPAPFRLSYVPPADRPLPFNIIVYHYSKEDPSKVVFNAADLMSTYRVFYVSSGLYNHRNPEINAQNTSAPASTAQVTLPKTKFMFWMQNLSDHRVTKAQEVDLLDTYLYSMKKWPFPVKASIVLKVD